MGAGVRVHIVDGFSWSALEKIRKLEFADPVKIFYSGLGMWDAENVRSVKDLTGLITA